MANTSDEQREREKKVAEAATQAQSTQKSGCLIGVIVLFILGYIVESVSGGIGEGAFWIILVVAIIAGIIVAVSNKNKTNTAVSQAVKNMETVQEKRRRDMNETIKSAQISGFIFSKTVYNTTNTACLALDSTNKKLLVKDNSMSNILTYNQMVSYELCKDGSAIISGNANSALVGGLLFGTVGAVAGAAGSSKDVNKYCSEMYISIVDMNARRYRLFLITEPVLESSVDYKVAIERAREMLSILSVVDADNLKEREKTISSAKTDSPVKRNIDPSTSNTTVSAADEIRKFKELADSGIITIEEYEAKKRQLLGL